MEATALTISFRHDHVVVTLHHELDVVACIALHGLDPTSLSRDHVVLDLRRVDSIGSRAFALVADAADDLRARGCRVTVLAV